MEIFGYTITRKEKPGKLETFQLDKDVSADISEFTETSGVISYDYDLATVPQSEVELIRTYRKIALSPDIDLALGEIKNEIFVFDVPGRKAFEATFPENCALSDDLQIKVGEEVENIYNILDFGNNGLNLFMDFYVDGKLYLHKLIDKTKPKLGIQKTVQIDPLSIKRIREVPKKDEKGIFDISKIKEYYIYKAYQESQHSYAEGQTGLVISIDAISFVDSGIKDRESNLTVGNLYKAIIPYNNLKLMEDSSIVLRVSRSPERRVIYVDVGNLPKARAESYIKDLMNKFKTKLVYDSKTGNIADRKNVLSMVEDFWLPRREGGKGTEITTLPGCLAMDTKITLLGGTEKTITELANDLAEGKELWTYSCDPITGGIKPGLISWAGITQKSADVLRLSLSNGKSIICTPDHKFPINGNGFIRADELTLNSKIISFHKHNNAIFDTNLEQWVCDSTDNYKKFIPVSDTDQMDNVEQPDDLVITAIEILAERIEVGTLTIDSDEFIHNYHTFALSAGIFTKNSENVGVMTDIEYFRNKLYQALNVPASRFKEEQGVFTFGKNTEINRDEYRFKKFLDRIRSRFMVIIEDLLKTQLILKKIILPEDWPNIKNDLQWNFTEDNAFVEYKESEIIMNRINTIQAVDPFIGKYFTEEWAFKNILHYSEEEIKTIKGISTDKEDSAESDSTETDNTEISDENDSEEGSDWSSDAEDSTDDETVSDEKPSDDSSWG